MRFAFLLAALILAGSQAVASTPSEGIPWTCELNTRLSGVASHYFYYGRDSWTGNARLQCERGNLHQSQLVEVSYNSLKDGFGADLNSVLQLRLKMTDYHPRPEFLIHSVVINQNAGLPAEWRIQGDSCYAEVHVNSIACAGAERSLNQGTIYIRPKLSNVLTDD